MSENPQQDHPHVPGFGTRAVHAGQHLDEVYGAVVPPLHISSTYAPRAIGELRRGYDYGVIRLAASLASESAICAGVPSNTRPQPPEKRH